MDYILHSRSGAHTRFISSIFNKLASFIMATKPSLSLSPLADRVVVKPLEAKEETVLASGIIIPETGAKEKPSKGKVVAVGPGRFDDGELVPMSVKVGQTVLFTKYGYDEVKVDGQDYFILAESQVLAIINN